MSARRRPLPKGDRARRAADEALLRMVRLRASGLSSADVAARVGLTPEAVRVATSRVVQDDIDMSGEDVAAVRAAYWGAA